MEVYPLVSVVTPFYNTQNYLGECIKSVLSQTYPNIEYILVNNKSTDASRRIAFHYAKHYPHLRLIDADRFRSQVENYNYALRHISADSHYTKLVQADDWIYPECIERMVNTARLDEKIGLVSSYQLRGREVAGSGLPYNRSIFDGDEIATNHLETNYFLFGNPTSVMYRSNIVRRDYNFYNPNMFAEDTDVCYNILLNNKFGFVHRIATFQRVEEDSIHGKILKYGPGFAESKIFAEKYAKEFMDSKNAFKIINKMDSKYYKFLGSALLEGRGEDFWHFHEQAISCVNQEIDYTRVYKEAFKEVFRKMPNPLKFFRNRLSVVQSL